MFFFTEFSKSRVNPNQKWHEPPSPAPETRIERYAQGPIGPNANGITLNHDGVAVLQRGRRLERLANFVNPTDYNAHVRPRIPPRNW